MLRARITGKGRANVAQQAQRRVKAANAELGRQFAMNIAEAVKAELPRGGWFTIYAQAVSYFESSGGEEWAAAGLWPREFSTFPADSTLIEFGGSTEVARIMASRNPWPMDAIPGLTGGYRATARAKQAAGGELEAARDRIGNIIDDVKAELSRAGAPTQDDAFPIIAGTVYADIGHLALRLEHGLGGLPRHPVWAKAFLRAQTAAIRWAEEARPNVESVLRGASSSTAMPSMPDDLRRELRQGHG